MAYSGANLPAIVVLLLFYGLCRKPQLGNYDLGFSSVSGKVFFKRPSWCMLEVSVVAALGKLRANCNLSSCTLGD